MNRTRHSIRVTEALGYVSFVVLLLTVGCEKKEQFNLVENSETAQAEISFRHRIKILSGNLEKNENSFRQSAYGLCCEIRNESEQDVRMRLIAVYTNAVQNITIDISPDCFNDEEGLKGIDIRLRNSWSLAEWCTAALFDLEPANPNGWRFLITGVLRWRNALAMIDAKIQQGVPKPQWRNRLLAFKRHLDIMHESKFWGLGKTYWSLREKMNQQQRQEVRQRIKEAFGELPLEMARDEPK